MTRLIFAADALLDPDLVRDHARAPGSAGEQAGGEQCAEAEQAEEPVVGQRQQRDQLVDPGVYEVDRGRFERLHEARREPDGDHVAVPRLLSPPGDEPQEVRLRARLARQVLHQDIVRLVVGSSHTLIFPYIPISNCRR